jgi:acyl-CoA reductase-like NAD-dependent aldehyde dehydrogenase
VGVSGEEEVIMIADDSEYGLAAGIWTEDHGPAIALAEPIDAGTVYLNNYCNTCAHSPVGGFKKSCPGRENGWPGMMEFLQTKNIWLNSARKTPRPFGS